MKNKAHRSAGSRRDPSREKFWRGMLRRFAASGLTVRGFCSRHGLSEPAFYSWRRVLAERDATAAPESSHPVFLPVRLAAATTGVMEIVLACGRRIRLRGPVDRAALAEVLAALEAQAPPPEASSC